MTRPRLPRSAVLALLLASASAPALAGGKPPKTIPANQLLPTMEQELDGLRAKIKELPDALSRAKAMEVVDRTEKEFRKRLKAVEKQKNYAIEAEYLGDAFERLVIKPTNETISVMRDTKMQFSAKSARVDRIRGDAEIAQRRFDKEFYAKHRAEIDAVVEERVTSVPAFTAWGGSGMEKFQSLSPLIRAGKESIKAANTPGPGPNTGGASAGGSTGTDNGTAGNGTADNGSGGGGTAPNGDPAAGGSHGATWSDVMAGNADNAPQAITDGAGEALQKGDYDEAASLARLALQFDPRNKDAMGVLQSASGRSDGAAAGAASMGAANAGASAFATSGFAGEEGGGGGLAAGGGFASASPSASLSAAAAAGAARVAGEQAQAGARSALKLGDAQGALDILNKALAQDPRNPALLGLRAATYGRLGRWEEALKDASAGLALVPPPARESMGLLITKATAENRTHRYREALATSNVMLSMDPRSAWGYANRAHAYGGLGNRDAMLADINRAAALDPRFQQAAADAALLQLPSDSDVLFLFPGESSRGARPAPAAAAGSPGRGRSFGLVVGAGLAGGLLLALGLLSTVLAPIKETVVSAFTRVKRTGPATNTAAATAQPASAAASPSGLIRGQYEISRQIGAGGMGMVYEGTDKSLGRRVAIKKMRDELRLNARERDRFIIEAKTVASLHHPNIVDIFAIAEEGEDVYLVFEYVDGKTVHDLVQLKGRLDVPEAVRVARAMGDALTFAHSKGVIHRDMKPSNVMLTSAGQVKVMDFGIARMAKDALTRYSMTNTVVGTPPYMAPEQEQGVVRKESDVYALAICAYEMLTGKLPFIGLGAGMLMNKINMSYIPPSRAIAGLPETLDGVFVKAFQADPEQRYRTPQEFVAALSAAADGARSRAA